MIIIIILLRFNIADNCIEESCIFYKLEQKHIQVVLLVRLIALNAINYKNKFEFLIKSSLYPTSPSFKILYFINLSTTLQNSTNKNNKVLKIVI